jgi:hypothetical protein
MSPHRIDLDHEPDSHETLTKVKKANGKWAVWGINLNTFQLILALGAIVTMFYGAMVWGSEIYWRLFAERQVDEEVTEQLFELKAKVDRFPSEYVSLKDEQQTLISLQKQSDDTRTWIKGISEQVKFIYEQAYIRQYGRMPPGTPAEHPYPAVAQPKDEKKK